MNWRDQVRAKYPRAECRPIGGHGAGVWVVFQMEYKLGCRVIDAKRVELGRGPSPLLAWKAAKNQVNKPKD